ncbi:MAG: guanylate kinase [Bacilli bacterium]
MKTTKKGTLIVISGPSGAGKGTIVKELLKEENIWLSISATTRARRISETEGVDYYFLDDTQFQQMITDGAFLEYAEVHSHKFYGTPKAPILNKLENGIDVILEIDIVGATRIKEAYPETIFIFIVPPSMKELKKRLINRHTESKDKIIERFKTAYKEINEISKYNYVVVNDKVPIAVSKVKAIITAEKCRVDRIIDVDLHNKEEELHELLVEYNSES